VLDFLSPLLQALRFAWLLTLHPARAGRTYAAYVVFIFSRLRCGSGRSMASDLLHGMWPDLRWLSRGWPSLCLRRDRPRYGNRGTSGLKGLARPNNLTFGLVHKIINKDQKDRG
jgi:hypothetical protein